MLNNKMIEMKTAIVSTSKHGTTGKVAHLIGEKLKGTTDVELFSLKDTPNPDIRKFDMIVLGTSIYAGQPSKKMKAFCSENETALLQKRLGLFVCGMHPDKVEQDKETQSTYSGALQRHALATAFLGGEFIFEEMNFFERTIARMITKTKTSVSRIDNDGIEAFAQKIR
jgi:menaquinone-dependent protoporphyrinogen oxidase